MYKAGIIGLGHIASSYGGAYTHVGGILESEPSWVSGDPSSSISVAMADIDERRSGLLAVVSRYIGDNLKVGLGYNFTDFSDDLTDLDFDSQGYFINLVGKI